MERLDIELYQSFFKGEKGDKGDKGDKGEPFTYWEFLNTSEYKTIVEAENKRIEAELKREQNETARENREKDRVMNDTKRQENERTRNISESLRANAEQERQEAEINRTTKFQNNLANWDKEVDEAIAAAETAEETRAATFASSMGNWQTEVDSTVDNANQAAAAAIAATQELLTHACANAITPNENGYVISVGDAAANEALKPITHIQAKQSGTGEASASNIRPINGWDVATLTRTNDNLVSHLDANFTQGHKNAIVTAEYIDITTPSTYDYQRYENVQLRAGQPYTLVIDCEVYGRDESDTRTTTFAYRITAASNTSKGENINKNGKYRYIVRFTPETDLTTQILWNPNYNNTGSGKVASCSRSSVMVIEGDYTAATAPAFIPCDKVEINHTLPETVYGGTLDWNTGILTITHGKVELDGESTDKKATKASNKYYNTFMVSTNSWGRLAKANAPLLVSHYVYNGTAPGSSAVTKQGVMICSAPGSLYIGDSGFADAAAYNAWLKEQYAAGTPVSIVYELETPITHQLTAQQINMLKGKNNVWSNSGNTELSYIADTKLYIDGKFNELQQALLSTGSNV